MYTFQSLPRQAIVISGLFAIVLVVSTVGSGVFASPVAAQSTSPDKTVQQIITEIKQLNLGYVKLNQKTKTKIKNNLRALATQKLSEDQEQTRITNVITLMKRATPDKTLSSREKTQIKWVISDSLGKDGRASKSAFNIDFVGFMTDKFRAIAELFEKAFNWLLDTVYKLTLGTPVPKNTGWHGILGEPTNQPFKSLYNKLLVSIIYPLMNYLLGLSVIFLGISLAVNPFMSRYRIWDLIIKFTTGLFLYAFSWPAITIMHGVVYDITNFIVPNASMVTKSATNLLAFGSAIPVAAYLGGASVGFTSLLGVGLVFGLRQILLTTIFPYIFAPLVLTAYIAPWSGMRRFAHTMIWQYVNVLTMVIPMALVLRAAVVVKWSWGFGGFAAVLVILGLFLLMAAYPIVGVYLFLQVPGLVRSGASSVASDAVSRGKSVKDQFSGSEDNTKSATSATTGTTPNTRATAMSEAQEKTTTTTARHRSRSAGFTTTAAKIRNRYRHDKNRTQSGTMTPEAMKEAFSRGDRHHILSDKGGDRP
jgi:hypothetical protein